MLTEKDKTFIAKTCDYYLKKFILESSSEKLRKTKIFDGNMYRKIYHTCDLSSLSMKKILKQNNITLELKNITLGSSDYFDQFLSNECSTKVNIFLIENFEIVLENVLSEDIFLKYHFCLENLYFKKKGKKIEYVFLPEESALKIKRSIIYENPFSNIENINKLSLDDSHILYYNGYFNEKTMENKNKGMENYKNFIYDDKYFYFGLTIYFKNGDLRQKFFNEKHCKTVFADFFEHGIFNLKNMSKDDLNFFWLVDEIPRIFKPR